MFTAHVFTDECCVQLSANNRFVFCLRGDVQRRVKSVHKNPVKVMIWGGISWRGATPLVMFDTGSKINNGMYQAVLETAYKKWASRKTFGEHVYLIQDNAPSHTAARTMEYLEKEQIKNLSHLKEGIATWWKDTLTTEKCKEYIRRVQPQMRKVIENEGAPVHD
ncbi:hypothetical protein PENTCL1PPCAC_328 [Pristionchus entomophagus]|uniref:Rhodanese domain-containing protein n=1 Tax=Pristionchus entomophagus TaxID=358040 RepID=A0AAV5S6S5_9BILA|nr:hypothetical protein PENTCL1PPCAC_328 [Pristionchus entomophagus]